jgi:hypothetical protein
VRPCVSEPGEVSLRFGNGLVPLVGSDGSDLGQQLVLANLHGPVAGRPVGQEALRPEGRRTEKLEQETNALDRPEQLLDTPARNALTVDNGRLLRLENRAVRFSEMTEQTRGLRASMDDAWATAVTRRQP